MKAVFKWILGGLALLIVVALGTIWYYSNNWKPIVENKLKEVVHNATDGLYSLKYDGLDFNVGLGNATLRNAELVPDSAVYDSLINVKEAPNNRYHIKLSALKIRRFNLMDVLSHRKLNIKSIEFENPNIHLISQYHAYNDTVSNRPKKTLYENVKDIFTSINVKDVKIDNIKFKYTKLDNGNSSVLNLDKVNINVHDVLVDETSLSDSSRFFYTKMVDVQVPGFEYDLPDGFYKVKFDDLKINTRDQNIMMTKVSYQPKMSKAAFFKQKNQNVTMAVLKFDTLRMEKLNFKELIDNQQTIASKVQLKNGKVDLYADTRYPKYPIVKVGSSPHQQLMKMKKLLRLDTVYVENVDLGYHQMSGKFFKEGSIVFNHIRGALTNVTNDTLTLKSNKFMKADLSAKVMNAGALNAKFAFDMLSTSGYHTYSGTLGSMKAAAFNRILVPLLNVELASGNIKSLSYNMEGTDKRNWGSLTFDYDDLNISLLNKDKNKDGEQSSKKVISWVVNQVLINNSNPDKNGVRLVGKVNYTRVPQHTFFKTYWQSLLDGIKQCAGISKEREAKLMGTAETGKEVVEGAKHVVDEAKGVAKKTGNFIKGIFKKDKSEEDSKK